MGRATRFAAAAAVVTLATSCGGSSTGPQTGSSSTPTASASAPTSGSLASLALTAAEATRYGGQAVAANPGPSTVLGRGSGSTLDVCNASFPSEAMREQRYQEFFHAASDVHIVVESNEVVRYRPGGTVQAYRELRSIAHHCGAMTLNGVRVSKPRILPPDPKLAPRQLTMSFSQSRAGKTVYSAAVYQYAGDLFDGVYVFRGGPQDATAAARGLAEFIAPRLEAAASAS